MIAAISIGIKKRGCILVQITTNAILSWRSDSRNKNIGLPGRMGESSIHAGDDQLFLWHWIRRCHLHRSIGRDSR
jgi:hypothetical protein